MLGSGKLKSALALSGTGKGTIALYKGQEVVQKNIDEKDAVGSLIDIIKENI